MLSDGKFVRNKKVIDFCIKFTEILMIQKIKVFFWSDNNNSSYLCVAALCPEGNIESADYPRSFKIYYNYIKLTGTFNSIKGILSVFFDDPKGYVSDSENLNNKMENGKPIRNNKCFSSIRCRKY